jgi:hypothetical protein
VENREKRKMSTSYSGELLLSSGKKDEKKERNDLVDIVFAWSLNNIFDRNLFKKKVSSSKSYLRQYLLFLFSMLYILHTFKEKKRFITCYLFIQKHLLTLKGHVQQFCRLRRYQRYLDHLRSM